MGQMIEVRWHARGGQGAKTAATFLAEAAISEDKFSQGFPEYGPERMGAPMRGFTRISDSPIRVHCTIENPDVVVVLDDSLLNTVDVCEGLSKDGIVLVNSSKDSETIRKQLKSNHAKLYVVNATQIALDTIGRPIPNTPMIGALVKTTDCISLDSAVKEVNKKFRKKFRDEIVEGNINALKRAYDEVKQ